MTKQTSGKMLRRRFGRTEIQIPVFSTGGMRYQHKWEDCPLDEVPDENQKNLEATIRKSVEVGINHIETARGYGSSERQLGLVLPTFPRDEIIVQTKIAPNADANVFRKEFEESLERLKLSHVDLLAIHGINDQETSDWALEKGGCLEMCRQIQKKGLAKHIGFSTHGPTDIIVNAINHPEHGGFDYVNLHWYYIYQRNWAAVQAAKNRDTGVFIISPSDKGGLLYKAPQKLHDLTAPLHPIVFNDLYCLNQPDIHTLSIGAEKPSDYDLHLEALKYYDQRHELLPPILERLEKAKVDALGKNYAQKFWEGIPDSRDSPGQINLQIILWLQVLAKSFDMTEYAKMRYNLLGNAGHWFPGTNAAEFDETAILEATKNSPFQNQIPEKLRQAHSEYFTAPAKRLSES